MWLDRVLEVALGNAGFAVVLALLVAVASRWVRRPAVLHVMWLLVLLRLLAPPMVELALLPAPAQPRQAMVAVPLEAGPAVPVDRVQATNWPSLRQVAVAVWVLGGALLLVLAALRTGRLLRALRSARRPDAVLAERVRLLARAMGVRPPRVLLVQGLVPPMVWGGLGRPALILPADLLPRLGEAELETLLGHELAHLRRRDHWVRYLELVAVTLFWWNPVAWWASRSLRAAEEECCDAVVAQRLPGTGRAYASGLVKTMRYLAGAAAPMPVTVTAASHFKEIERRIRAIMSGNVSRTMTTPVRGALSVLVLAALAITPTLAARAAPTNSAALQLAGLDGEPVTLELEDADLQDVLRTLAAVGKLNVVIDPAVTLGQMGTLVTVNLKEVPLEQAVDLVLAQAGLASTLDGSMLWVHPPGKSPTADREFTGKPIGMAMDGADLRDFLEVFERLADVRIEVDDDISGRVTADLRNVPWDQALDLVLRANGLTAEDEGGVLRVRRAGSASAVLLQPKPPIKVVRRAAAGGDEPVYRFRHGSGMTEPVCLSCPLPEYQVAAAAGLEEDVKVLVKTVITADGRVAEAEVVNGAPPDLADATLAAVREWVFEPARVDGEAIAVEYVLSVLIEPGDR